MIDKKVTVRNNNLDGTELIEGIATIRGWSLEASYDNRILAVVEFDNEPGERFDRWINTEDIID